MKAKIYKSVMVILAAVLSLQGIRLDAQGVIRAKVVDASDSSPLTGAGIVRTDRTGTSIQGTVSGIDGCFEISAEEAGEYEISFIGYISTAIRVAGGAIVLADGKRPELSGEGIPTIRLELETSFLEKAVVTGRKRSESIKSLDNERIMSGHAIENIGSAEMGLKGLSNAMESVTKLSGISLSGAGRLTVRGLGDRYSITTLNGMPVGSPNPDNKLAPLEMFPSSTIKNVTVSKVFEASSFADYSGAHVDISTKTADGDRNTITVSLAAGSGVNTIGRERLSLQDGGFKVLKSGYLPEFDGFVAGTGSLGVGRQKLLVNAGLLLKNSSDFIGSAYFNTYEASGTRKSHFAYDSYKQRLDLASLVNLEQSLRRNDWIALCVFFARNDASSFQVRNGVDYEDRDMLGETEMRRIYTLVNGQLTGSHELGKFLFDWGLCASFNSGDEPDRRQMLFQRNDEGRLKFFTNNMETYRYFGELRDSEYSLSAKLSRTFDNASSLRFGLAARYRGRSFSTLRYLYDVSRIYDSFEDDQMLDMTQYLGEEAVEAGIVKVMTKQNARDRYTAWNAVGAAFAEYDFRLLDRLDVNLGIRFEADRCRVDYNDDVEDTFRILDSLDSFLALNLKYELKERQWLRLSLSRTITRPSFVEMAPFLYQESYGGIMLRGNAKLKNAYNYNLDLRYESFPLNGDKYSATAYVKWLVNPIERIQRYSGGAPEHSFQNAGSGFAAGVELELRKTLAKELVLSTNLSLMYTDVRLPEGGVYTNTERPLEGASPYIANIDLSYTPELRDGSKASLALSYNLTGPRIHSVGLSGLGDVMQQPLHELDFNASWPLLRSLSASLSLGNLLDMPVRFTQDVPSTGENVDIEGWRLGRSFKLGLKWNL